MSKKEIEFIKRNHTVLSPAELGRKLQRREDTIRKTMIEDLKIPPDDDLSQQRVDELSLQKELTNSPEWKALKAEFMDDELIYFKHRFGKLMAQFAQEQVLATEETQIFLLIKYEILMQRNLKDQKRSGTDLDRLEKMLEDIYSGYSNAKDMDDDDKSYALNLENQILSHRAAKQSKSTEYEKLTGRHSALMKELKGTRDQRITKIENSKQTFLDIIKELQNAEMSGRAGRHMELMSMAAAKEKERLSELHTYADGMIDQPLLTPENVK